MVMSSKQGKDHTASRLYKRYDVIVNRYEVERFIAEGGMSEVYLVYDTKLMRQKRAMKIAKQSHDPANIQPYKEALMLMELRHQHLPILYDVDEQSQIIIMEWIEGYTLHELLHQYHIRFQVHEVIAIAKQIYEALVYLHSHPRKIIHKDLKPSNIMLTPQGEVKLIDFGISKFYTQQSVKTISFGTPGFAAPEQMQGKSSNEQSDIYSFGAIVFYLLTHGKQLFNSGEASNPEHSLKKKLPYIPHPLTQLLEGCLQYESKYRFQSATELYPLLSTLAGSTNKEGGMSSNANMYANPPLTAAYRIAVLSLAPGAGSTTVAMAAADLFARFGQRVSLIEYIHEQGASFDQLPWLSLDNQTNKAAEGFPINGYRVMETEWMNWVIRDTNSLEPLEAVKSSFISVLASQQTEVVCIDCSSYWEADEMKDWLSLCELVILVTDPTTMTHNRYTTRKNQRLLLLLEQLKLEQFWIANKDIPFPGRKQWIELMANHPLITIPQLALTDVYRLLWQGKTITQHRKFNKMMQKKLMPFIKKVKQRLNI